MANPSINTVRDELHTQLLALIVGAGLAQTFKKFPMIATAEASPLSMLASMGSLPTPGTTAGDSNYYDFALVTAAKCERGDEATWQAAESQLLEQHDGTEHRESRIPIAAESPAAGFLKLQVRGVGSVGEELAGKREAGH